MWGVPHIFCVSYSKAMKLWTIDVWWWVTWCDCIIFKLKLFTEKKMLPLFKGALCTGYAISWMQSHECNYVLLLAWLSHVMYIIVSYNCIEVNNQFNAWAASALPLSYDNWTTTDPHNPLYVLSDQTNAWSFSVQGHRQLLASLASRIKFVARDKTWIRIFGHF